MVTATGDWLVTRVSVATNTSLERGGAVVVHHHHVALRVGVVRLVRAHRRVHPEGVHAVVRQPGGVEERRVVLAHLGYRVVQGHSVVTPALDISVVQFGAREIFASDEVVHDAVGAQVHRGQAVAHLAGGVPAARVLGVFIPKLAHAVFTPALERAVVQCGARMMIPRIEAHHGAAGAQ
eukprot:2507055-Pyramimonas_sp.AAC.1